MKKVLFLISLLVCIVLVSTPALGGGFKKSIGQTVYAAANHNCQWPPMPSPIAAAICTLSVNTRLMIRNVDPNHYITVTEVNYYDPDGILIPVHSDSELDLEIPPLASETYAIPSSYEYWSVYSDGRPSFIIKWKAEQRVHPPMISSSHAIINRAPAEPDPNPFSIDGLTVTPGVVLSEDKRHKK